MSKSYKIGVDIGGTFTDIVILDDAGNIFTKKLLSSPPDYSESIEVGVSALLAEKGISPSEVREFSHGTTVVTNTIIERKGARVALVTTRGFRDVVEIGRYRTPRLYDQSFQKPDPLAERQHRHEVTERIAADGSIVTALDEADLEAAAAAIEAAGIESVAVCFINSYVNPVHEEAAAQFLARRLPDCVVSASTQLLPQIQEYERTSTTLVNAYARPTAERYIDSLIARVRRIGIECDVNIMQSSGGGLPSQIAAKNPVYIVESGPAAGVVGAQRLSTRLGYDNIMVVDVGGTTAKASIIEGGVFTTTNEFEVGGEAAMGHRLMRGAGYCVQAPTIDIAEVGAGGGSIAAADPAGGIQVGPRSAGALPGPVCYGKGGESPTVTDANLVLGYLSPDALVGGDLKLDKAGAEHAITALGEEIGLSMVDTAYGIHLIANSTMMRALNGVSAERGRDPSQFTLFAIGGNGSVHGTKLADDLMMGTVIVPPVSGVFSALGLLFADVEHPVVRAFYRAWDEVEIGDLNALLADMAATARGLLEQSGFDAGHQSLVAVADVSYQGQMMTLPVQFSALEITPEVLATARKDFLAAHKGVFGYAPEHEPLQFVSLKVFGRGVSDAPRVPDTLNPVRTAQAQSSRRKVYFGPENGWLDTPVLPRASLSSEPIHGPAIIEEYESTTVIRPGWGAVIDSWNNIIIRKL